MKRMLYVFVVPLLLFVMASTAAAEGIRAQSFTLSGIVGGYTFDGEQHLETRPVIGIRCGYNFTRHFGAEALFDFVSTESTGKGRLDDADLYRYGGDLLLHFRPDNKLVPYLATGYSGITTDSDTSKAYTKGAFDYGPGIKYFLSDDLALRGDFRHLVLHGSETRFNYEYTVGLSWQFGGQKLAPVAAATPVAAPIAPPVTQTEPEPAPEPEAAPAPEAPLEPVPPSEPTPERVKYCVSLDIEFDIQKADVRPQYHDQIAKVGDFMKKYPGTTAFIEGYTDEVGSDEYNLQLSQQRAESVVKYLVDNFGIDPSRLSAKGYGKMRPIPTNPSDEERQKNRRINAIIDCPLVVKDLAPPPERLCMFLKVEFATNSAEIRPAYYAEVDTVGEYMKRYPTTTALIEGHTDNTGNATENMKLSQKRAESVVNYLVEKFKIEPSRLSAKGYGSTRRIAYNTTPEGRQKNRRINAIIDCITEK